METVTLPHQPAEIAASLDAGWRQFLLSTGRSTQSKRPNVYASSWRVCTRRMALEMAEGDSLPPWQPEQLANFRRGQDRERDLIADLRRIGRNAPLPFEVAHEQERFELKDRKGRVVITGKKDGDLVFAHGITCPFEVKAWNVNTVSRINSFDDIQRSPWTKPASFQLLAYLFGFGHPLGFFILDRNGLPLAIPVELEPHYGEMEDFLSRAEEALDASLAYQHAKNRDQNRETAESHLPPYIDDPAECKRCAFFGRLCNPPTMHNPARVLADPELEAQLTRREELRAAADEFEDLDAAVKSTLRGVEQGFCGNFFVQGKWQSNTTYPVPKEIKAQYKKVDEKGKFILSIEKL